MQPSLAGARPVTAAARFSQTSRFNVAALALLGLFVAAYALFFSWLSLQRFWDFQMHALDMGNMGQAAWNTIHGRPFRFTNMRPPYHIEAWGTTTRLSFHVEALFPVIALAYLVYPHPESLLVLQTVALALGAVPTFALARRVLDRDSLALLFAAMYLLYPSVEGMNLYEFHPVALATPLLIAAFYWMYTDRLLLFVCASLAAMGTKEELGLVVAMLALYGAIFLRHRKVGICLAAFGVAWSLFATVVVEHHYRQPGTLTYLHTRYAWLLGPANHSLSNAVHLLRHDPSAVIRVLLVWPKLAYAERLLAPAGYLALLSPVTLVVAAPTLVLNLFSDDFHMYSGFGQDSAEICAVIVVASIFGARFLIGLLSRRLPHAGSAFVVGLFLAIQGLAYQRSDGFTPMGARFVAPSMSAHAAVDQRFVGMIPAGAAVSTQDELDPAMSSRAGLYLFPDLGGAPASGLPAARYVLLDASGPIYPIPSYQLHDDAMSLLRNGWHIAAADDGLILLKQGAGRTIPPARFYSFAGTGVGWTPIRTHTATAGVELLGWSRQLLDQPNHPIPSVEYRLILRRVQSGPPVEPVVFELDGGRAIGCSSDPLGMAWYPSPRWPLRALRAFNMSPIETDESLIAAPSTATFAVELVRALPHDPSARACATLWRRHGRLAALGTLDLQF